MIMRTFDCWNEATPDESRMVKSTHVTGAALKFAEAELEAFGEISGDPFDVAVRDPEGTLTVFTVQRVARFDVSPNYERTDALREERNK